MIGGILILHWANKSFWWKNTSICLFHFCVFFICFFFLHLLFTLFYSLLFFICCGFIFLGAFFRHPFLRLFYGATPITWTDSDRLRWSWMDPTLVLAHFDSLISLSYLMAAFSTNLFGHLTCKIYENKLNWTVLDGTYRVFHNG